MTNRPKAIGTRFESAVRGFLIGDGWADCHRLAQTGVKDSGDLLICSAPRVVAECKAGAQAEAASAALIDQWMREAERERLHAGAVMCPLIVYRRRQPTANHDVWLPLWAVVHLDTGVHGDSYLPVRLSLADFSDLLKTWAGV